MGIDLQNCFYNYRVKIALQFIRSNNEHKTQSLSLGLTFTLQGTLEII